MRLSNSKAKTWRRCPKQFDFKYVQGLRPKRRKGAPELGTWIHDLLMTMYDGEDWKQVHRKRKREFLNLFEEEREEMGDLPQEALRIMRSYLRTYKDEDKKFRTVDSELDEIITLPSGIEFNFIIDQIIEDSKGGLWLRDHKTSSKFMDVDFMLIDAQLTRYFWCAEQMGYTPLRGVEFNEIRTKAPTVPDVLKSGQLSQAQKMDTDYWTYLATIKKHGLEPKDYMKTLRRLWDRDHNDHRFFRRSKLPKDKPVTSRMMDELAMTADEIATAERLGAFPRTADKSCTWMCDYLEPCIIELQGGDTSDVIKLKYERRKRNEEDG